MAASAWTESSLTPSARHRPRDGGGSYAARDLPNSLHDSDEAAEVWAAARAATDTNRLIEVRGWRVEWRPRLAHSSSAGHKRGDLYIFPPPDHAFGWGRPIRSLSALHDVLLLRKKEAQEGGSSWSPPMRGSLIEVRIGAADAPANGHGDDDPSAWRRAEVRKVELGLGGSFLVVMHTAAGEPDESNTRWCTAWDENSVWRRIAGQPQWARTRPGKRTRRCGQCAGCVAQDCGVCSACRDKPKFGGRGTMKQACSKRRCSQPTPPTDAAEEASALSPRRRKPAGRREAPKAPPPMGAILRRYVWDDDAGFAQVGGSYSGDGGAPAAAWPTMSGVPAERDDLKEDEEEDDDMAMEESAGVGANGAYAEVADATTAELRRQVVLAHQCARQYRKCAAETVRAACALYPLAHAGAGGEELEKPECLDRALERLPQGLPARRVREDIL